MNMECEEDGTEEDTETCDPDGEQTTVVIEVSTTTLHKTPTTEETVTATMTEVTTQEETVTATTTEVTTQEETDTATTTEVTAQEETDTATTTEVIAQEETDTAKAVPERPLEKHAVKTKTTMSLHAISHLQKVQQDGDSQKEHAK